LNSSSSGETGWVWQFAWKCFLQKSQLTSSSSKQWCQNGRWTITCHRYHISSKGRELNSPPSSFWHS
jgi:hypothetical protein